MRPARSSDVASGPRRTHAALAAAFVPLAVAAFVAVPVSSDAATGGATVVLKDIEFSKPKVTIRRGQTVTWRWQDGLTPHNVYSKGRPRFKGADTRKTGKHVVRFTKAGTYRYVCTIHPGMKGSVVVR